MLQRKAKTNTKIFRAHNHRSLLAMLLAVPALMLAAKSLTQTPTQFPPAGQTKPGPWTPVKLIDFSSKHDVMIRNSDGTLQPMDQPYHKATLIAPGTWQIESDGDYQYLLEGDNEALAIDSGYGAGNERAFMQTLTKKPVRYVANTHDHFDHTADNAYFDKAFMSKETAARATIPFPSFKGMDFPRNYPVQIIEEGYKFQLGNREVDVYMIPNHTKGGTAYLDKRERILFSGDEIFQGNNTMASWGSVENYRNNMRKLEDHRKEFDRLATGGFGVVDASWVDKFLANTEYILAGHEGDPITQGQGRQGGAGGPGGGGPSGAAVPQQAAAPGQIVYRRRVPRPGDGAEAALGIIVTPTPPEDLRKMTYDGCSITYDIRHIHIQN
jgi:glyoxylase-like metal-dependent hydrolase (beta-lactamase superfamily II)